MVTKEKNIASYDARLFFEKALAYGVDRKIINATQLKQFAEDGPKGILQIADHFGSRYLRSDIELALKRMVNLISIYLEEVNQGDVVAAATMLANNTLLSHSRGGSELIKKLYALPENGIIGSYKGVGLKEFQEVWTRHSFDKYSKEYKKRSLFKDEVDAALWMVKQIGVVNKTYDHEVAELVIRSALFLLLFGQERKYKYLPSAAEFAQIVLRLREEGTPRYNVDIAEWLKSAPAAYQKILTKIVSKIIKTDISEMLDKKLLLAELLDTLKQRYYLRMEDVEEVNRYDAIVSKEWVEFTKGKSDTDSLLTLFITMAGNFKTVVPTLTEKMAKELVKKIRKEGMGVDKVIVFIQSTAPVDMREDLLNLWEEFIQEAEIFLLDELDEKMLGAMSFLKDNCNVSSD
jgi:hypothetical protein